ncbi:methyl-accepting chemotaxis protein [Massilia sp. Bi118]|uniref:methyl-accepting chemotaxis protein n=1 Tax=Massilia sp. Bi118 TaxID=2822346 RepID=UPI0025B689D2|nr:methyl-accepting chemotaxis protein [Massilia sp. Bi118]
MKIGTRLGMAFGVVCLALAFTVGQGLTSLGRVNAASDTIVAKRMPRIDLTSRLLAEVNDIAIALRNAMLNDDPADRAKQVDEIMSSRKEIETDLAMLDKMLESQQGRALLAQQQDLNAKYVKAQDELLRLINANELDGAKAYLTKEVRPVLAAYKKAVAEQIEMQKGLAKRDADEATVTYEFARNLLLALGVLAVAGAGALAWWISASIVRPMRRALDVANAVAAGDLTTRVEVTSKCEAGQLLAALKTMNENLVQTVATVRSGTEAIGTASSEVAAGNHDLSSRTEQQASSLEETASSMEELTSTVKQNADNARQANTMAAAASGVAARGGQVIHEVVATMEQIHEASGKIADIIAVIDGIAFQTNILALNAAVEAARAGEQGRGFAVVAGEVRSLAHRSAAAAKEIKTLIDDSSEKVGTGSRLVQEAGSTMGDIVDSVRRVTDILNEISSASQEQSAGIEQVNEAITQMDTVTQQNAALVEQAAAASQSMQDTAAQLSAAVAVFKLDQRVAPVAAVAAAPVAVRAALPAARPAPVKPARPARPAKAAPVASDWEEF